LSVIKWHVDASFAVHPTLKPLAELLGWNRITDHRFETVYEQHHLGLVAADDMSTMVYGLNFFMWRNKATVKHNILYQDNKRARFCLKMVSEARENKPALLTFAISFNRSNC
jgi:hypothetical protein